MAAETSPTNSDFMLGATKRCPSCSGMTFARVKGSRAVQCACCALVVEEPARPYLAEYYAISDAEELHCAVTPDMRVDRLVVPDLPDDPYCTPGFITAFRMLSPLREPVYAASATTMCGALTELERQIGDCVYDSYVGYNGRAPSAANSEIQSTDHVRHLSQNRTSDIANQQTKENNIDPSSKSSCSFHNSVVIEAKDSSNNSNNSNNVNNNSNLNFSNSGNNDKSGSNNASTDLQHNGALINASNINNFNDGCQPNTNTTTGSDARHTLVAYFEILDLANILDVDHETATLAVRIFRFAATSTSLRNRNVEALAAASLWVALDRRHAEHSQWLATNPIHKHSPSTTNSQTLSKTNSDHHEAVIHNNSEPRTDDFDPASIPPRPVSLTLPQIAEAADLEQADIQRYLRLVNMAFGKNAADSLSGLSGRIPAYCDALELDEDTKSLAVAIAENAFRFDVCPRRNPASVSAAAIYMSCQLREVRKTQIGICRVMEVTEVTLRKVHKELLASYDQVIPPWFTASFSALHSKHRFSTNRTRTAPCLPSEVATESRLANVPREKVHGSSDIASPNASFLKRNSVAALQDEQCLQTNSEQTGIQHSLSRDRINGEDSKGKLVGSNSVSDVGNQNGKQEKPVRQSNENATFNAANCHVLPALLNPSPALAEQIQQQQQQLMLAMIQNPAMMQAVAGAMAMMPSLVVPPPPPPPLPTHTAEKTNSAKLTEEQVQQHEGGTETCPSGDSVEPRSRDEIQGNANSVHLSGNTIGRVANTTPEPIQQLQAGLHAMQAMLSCLTSQNSLLQNSSDMTRIPVVGAISERHPSSANALVKVSRPGESQSSVPELEEKHVDNQSANSETENLNLERSKAEASTESVEDPNHD